MEINTKVEHIYFRWQGVIESLLGEDVVFVRWKSGIANILNKDNLRVIHEDVHTNTG